MSAEAIKQEIRDFWYGHGAYSESLGNIPKNIDLLLSRNLVIPRTDVPEVFEDSRGPYLKTPGIEKNYHPENWTGEEYRAYAGQYLAMAEWREAKDAREKNAARDKRRDELASEFTAVNSYNGQLPYTQKLIDRIIDLEDKP